MERNYKSLGHGVNSCVHDRGVPRGTGQVKGKEVAWPMYKREANTRKRALGGELKDQGPGQKGKLRKRTKKLEE